MLQTSKKHFGGKLSLLSMALGGLALSIVLSFMSGAGTATRSSLFNGCMGHSTDFEVIDGY